MLQFTRDLAIAIVECRKVQTLRAKLPPGCVFGSQLTLMNGYHPGARFGYATIVAIDLVETARLTLRDAQLDGFDTLEDLRARLAKSKAPPDLWRIRWRDFSPTIAGQRLTTKDLRS